MVSLGGESFLVYLLADGRIANVLSHNKCAAGSGEFFVQQIGRMGLASRKPSGARSRARSCRWPPAARSIANRTSPTSSTGNEATPEDILHTLHDSMASKVVALLEKAQRELQRVLLIGGVTRNAAMLAALREKLPGHGVRGAPGEPVVRGLGQRPARRGTNRFTSRRRSQSSRAWATSRRCISYADRVEVIAAAARQAPPDGPMVLGVDAGSTTTKAILLDPATREVVASHYTRTNGDPVAAARQCLRSLAEPGRQPPGRPGGDHRLGARPRSAPTWAPSMSITRSRPRPPGRRTSTPTWTRSSRSAARTPSTSTCATACPLTTR